jgi:phosphoribosyl-ATP pyrophosphohydrolase/phosphoribosyl-AMP cyclohydrolase/histidinol dehydrogenase
MLFVELLETEIDKIEEVSRVCDVILDEDFKYKPSKNLWIKTQHNFKRLLNSNIGGIVIPYGVFSLESDLEYIFGNCHPSRIIVTVKNNDELLDVSSKGLSCLVNKVPSVRPPNSKIIVCNSLLKYNPDIPSYISKLDSMDYTVCLKLSEISMPLGKLIGLIVRSDRTDDLIPTAVVDEDEKLLGLVYSSRESLSMAIETGRGVYFSRSRNEIWEKGKSSGCTQELLRIEIDCDRDSLKFVVFQKNSFCHTGKRSCFGNQNGLQKLFTTLNSRKKNPVPNSYTNKLFNSDDFLHKKILEECNELVEANTFDDVIAEISDVLYFSFVKCVKYGVTLFDIVEMLDSRTRKVTRRPGGVKNSDSGAFSSAMSKVATKDCLNLDQNGIHIYKFEDCNIKSLIRRPMQENEAVSSLVKTILERVRAHGDSALLEYALKFDNVDLQHLVLRPPFIIPEIDESVKCAIDIAYDNIYKFHAFQHKNKDNPLVVETMPGIVCSRFSKPVKRVGLYIPGGSSVLPSTALMLGIPAQIAGCETIIFATPPRKDGSISPEILYVAQKVGATMVLCSGGAQAIGALAYGTESVTKVDKICGPGNMFVTSAKMIVQSDPKSVVSIDMPAGPSEVLIIADKWANPEFIAADLLSQAEHGPDSQCVLLTVGVDDVFISQIENAICSQVQTLPRKEIVHKSLAHAFIVKCNTYSDAMSFSNEYAPEHLILNVFNPHDLLKSVESAGSVFLGPLSPESFGDYASGTNHTLPTHGYAKCYSGVNSDVFLKYITAQEISEVGFKNLAHTVETLAELENLHGHKRAVTVRMKLLK